MTKTSKGAFFVKVLKEFTAKEKLEIVSGVAPPRTEKLPKNRQNIGLNHIL